MNWFKKIFQRFNREIEEDTYVENPVHTEGNRDVEARIIYQYPKGQFRFPLIPDEEVNKPRSRNENRKQPSQPQPEPQPVRKRSEPKANSEEMSRVQRKKNISNRAFRPSETPSPIYGLEPRSSKSEPIEYELDHFSKETVVPEPVVEQIVEEIPKTEREAVPVNLVKEPIVHQDEQVQREQTNDEYIEKQQIQFDREPSIHEELAIKQDTEEKDREQRKRSHIPFNVHMLKEDKRKWQERKQTRHELAKEEVSAAVEETEVDQPAVESPAVDLPSRASKTVMEEEPYYVFPSLDLLKPPVFKNVDVEWLQLQEELLNETLLNFNVRASVANVTQGPSVTRFEVRPEPGVKVNKITNLADDIKLSLAAKDIRMEAPIPGTHMIGIEVPNDSSRPVFISEILTSSAFSTSSSPLTAVLGLDIAGRPIVTDLRKMPHGLIAGATGSGKSVCINSILVSLLYKANPNDVKLLLIDPKMVELAPYNGIPHLVSPVITDVKAATAALKWAVDEMERRYELFAHGGVRDITRFNEVAEQEKNYSAKLPYIVIVIDELADLMMMSPADVEEAICRIAQKARACGIHLIIATQRPSVDVITGLIKANVPTRIAFSVSSQIDSRTIIDISGAERLLGRGDMLFLENGSSKPVRLQGTFVTDGEIDAIVQHVQRERSPEYLFQQEELLKKATLTEEEDELFYEACEFVVDQGGASTSSLQRKFKIGYNRAARLMDMMEEHGFISEQKGSKPRDVLITEADLESIQDT